MPNTLANYTINDGTATPVAVSYSLEDKNGGQLVIVDRRLASRELQPEIIAGLKRPNGNARTYNVTRTVKMPVVRSINGVDTVVDVNKVLLTYVISKACTEQERKHLYAAGTNANAHADFKTQVEKLEAWN